MRVTLESACIDGQEVDAINAHGTGTKANGSTETAAIRSVFVRRTNDIPISAPKAMHHHLRAAAGALECVLSLMAMRRAVALPTMHLQTPDPTLAATATTHEQRVLQLAHVHTLLRPRDLTRHGLPTIAMTRLVQAGQLDHVARGRCGLPGAKISEHRSMAKVSVRVPKGVVCLLSALGVHEIDTQAPFEFWIAIPQHMVTPRLDQPAIRVVRMSYGALADGVERINIDGIAVPVSSAARTVVDCFRFRNKIGVDVALEALRDGWSRRKFTLDDLWCHATGGRVANVMRSYIEAITS